MKIEDTNAAATSVLAVRTEAPAVLRDEGLAAGAAGRAAPSGDRVELSGLTGRLAETLAVDSRRRAARVESLATEVKSGSYAVDMRGVSHALVVETLRARADRPSGQAGT